MGIWFKSEKHSFDSDCIWGKNKVFENLKKKHFRNVRVDLGYVNFKDIFGGYQSTH